MRAYVVGFAAVFLLLAAGGTRAASGSVTLSPGQESTVATFSMKVGDSLEFTYSTGFSVTFRILRGATEVSNTTSTAAHGTYAATVDGTYSAVFRNDGAYMTAVSYNIDQKTTPTGNLILIGGIGAGVAAVSAAGVALALRARGKRAPTQPQGPQPPPSA